MTSPRPKPIALRRLKATKVHIKTKTGDHGAA
jgi:hypothetical protein